MGRWVLLVTLVLAGCREKKVTPDDGQLSVSPAMIDFGSVWAGYPVDRTVSVAFSGMSSCDVTLSATAPFTVTPSAHLEKASSVNVTVSVTASGAGSLSGTLTATGCGHTATASLSAGAFAVPDCGSEGACTTVHFDPDAGTCLTQRKPDDTVCPDPCLVQPHCNAGECVGAFVSCDDGNACTIDACASDGGCEHFGAQSFCPPLLGCTSPCDGGLCGTLTEVWSLPGQVNVLDPLLADPQGNLYWLENGNSIGLSGWLVSVNHGGVLRYRVGVLLVGSQVWSMVADGTFVYLDQNFGSVFGVRAPDGYLLWGENLRGAVADAGHPEVANMIERGGRGAVAPSGELLFPIGFSNAGGQSSAWAVGVDPATGSTTSVSALADPPFALEVDEAGQLYESVLSSSGYSLDAYSAGGVAWKAAHTLGPVTQGRVFTPDLLLDSSDGGAVGAPFGVGEIPPDVATATVAVRRDSSFGRFVFFDPQTGAERSRVDMPDIGNWDLYGAGAGEVIAFNRGASPRLDGFDSDGGHLYQCSVPLAPQNDVSGSSVLLDGLLMMWTWDRASATHVLHAYALPGRREAAHGWVTRYGSAARTNRPK